MGALLVATAFWRTFPFACEACFVQNQPALLDGERCLRCKAKDRRNRSAGPSIQVKATDSTRNLADRQPSATQPITRQTHAPSPKFLQHRYAKVANTKRRQKGATDRPPPKIRPWTHPRALIRRRESIVLTGKRKLDAQLQLPLPH